MTTIYGIKNCDTIKKARQWLERHNVTYTFHDFREHGIDSNKIKQWLDQLGWETVVNKRSTTWKQLDPQNRDNMDTALALKTILEHPTLVKRPVLETATHLHIGFKEADYITIFK